MTTLLFAQLLDVPDFTDLATVRPDLERLDVIIPTLNSDLFFDRNLRSIYREIPVNRLLLGDGGCEDATVETVRRFPRVVVYDHRSHGSLGASLRDLILNVQTRHFAYFHADVFLPVGFGDVLRHTSLEKSWVESARNALLVREEYASEYQIAPRSYSGAQFGDTSLLQRAVTGLDDDYIQRNEDIIISDLVRKLGGNHCKRSDLVHLHQSPVVRTSGAPRYHDRAWAVKTYSMQVRGIIKYLEPPTSADRQYLADEVNGSIRELRLLNALNFWELADWVRRVNAGWLPFLQKPRHPSLVEARRRVFGALRLLVNGTT